MAGAATAATAGAWPSHQALEQAAEWFALLRSGEASDEERRAWRSWHGTNREHAEAWRRVEAIGSRFEPLLQRPAEREPAVAALQSVRSQRVSRRQVVGGMAAVAGSTALGWAAWRHTGLPDTLAAWNADHRTRVGEIRDITLADGSQVVLNTDSALDIELGPSLRRLSLLAGETLVHTAADTTRPLMMDTPAGHLLAGEARFSVRLGEGQTCVAVYEGQLEIRTRRGNTRGLIEAGQQTRFHDDTIAARSAADPARQAWTRGVLLAQDIPLKELVAELARYRRGHLGVAPEVAHLRVLGGFPLRDPDKALAMLAKVLPIRVQRTLPWWTTLEPRR